MKIINLRFFYLIFFLGIFISSVNASLFINSFNFNKKISDGFLNYNLTIANSEDIVLSGIEVRLDIVNTNENNLILFKDSFNLDFYKYEAKIINKKIDLSDLPNGNFTMNVVIYEKSGSPISGFKKRIEIINNKNYKNTYFNLISSSISNGPYLISEDRNGAKLDESHGMLGKNLKPNSNIYLGIKFNNNLNNEIKNNLKVSINLFASYSLNNSVYKKEKTLLNYNYTIGKLKIDYSKPGTYNVQVNFFYNNIFLFSKTIRLVIAGKSGGIMNVFNSKDIYKSGEFFNLKGYLIGSADGASKISNASLELKIIQDNNLVLDKTKFIGNLNFEAVNFVFNEKLNQDLNNYVVQLFLRDGNYLLDNITLNYEKLNPEFLYKNGIVYKNDKNLCLDDGICTQNENKIGNCLDCHLKEIEKYMNKPKDSNEINNSISKKINNLEPKNNSNKYILLLVSFLVIFFGSLSVVFYIRKNKMEEKKNE